MRIFIAGATGTLGRPVVRILRSHGHDLVGLTRSPERARALAAQGVQAVIGDALDGESLTRQVTEAQPEQVLHLLTALPPAGPLRKRHLTATNELRTRGTANLIAATLEAGASRLVAESFVSVYGAVDPSRLIGEGDPIAPIAPGLFADTVAALRSHEAQLLAARSDRLTTVALRIGYLYGPEVPAMAALARQARAGWLFVPRSFTGVGPFVHLEDAATAIVAAIEHPDPSPVYNVVDDQPMVLDAFMTRLATALGAPPPRHLPLWLVRLAAPLMEEFGMATLRLSNRRIKQELGWTPRYPTVAAGIATMGQLAEAA